MTTTHKPISTVAAFSVAGIAPIYVSRALSLLTITHLTCGYDPLMFKHRTRRTKAPCTNPPAMPVICIGLDAVVKFQSNYERHVLFVCDTLAKLKHTSLQPLPGNERGALSDRIKNALLAPWHKDLRILVDEPSLMEYVDKASKPSLLRGLQTSFYKINPYDLRKEVQHTVFLYISGKLSKRKAMEVIDKCSRAEEIKEQLQSAASQILIRALKDAKNMPVQQVADNYGLDVFDLNFVRATSKN